MYDGQDIVADYRPARRSGGGFEVTVEYTNALAIDSKVARIETDDDDNAERLFYLGDALNSVNALVDDEAKVENRQLTNAWGEELVLNQDTADRYGFTSRENDRESSLMHFRVRSYDPRIGRFVQKNLALLNRIAEHYVYVRARPTWLTDPSGLQSVHPDRLDEASLYAKQARYSRRLRGLFDKYKNAAVYKAIRLDRPGTAPVDLRPPLSAFRGPTGDCNLRQYTLCFNSTEPRL
jgi:RHS repeat-associated protein